VGILLKDRKDNHFSASLISVTALNDVANATLIAGQDTSITNDGNYVTLHRGSQTHRPVNIEWILEYKFFSQLRGCNISYQV
jgi:hypothetical protein